MHTGELNAVDIQYRRLVLHREGYGGEWGESRHS